MAALNTVSLKDKINTLITNNGANGITGNELNELLLDIADSLLNKASDGNLIVGLKTYDPARSYTVGEGCFRASDGAVMMCVTVTTGTYNAAHWQVAADEKQSNRGVANGYAPLGSDAKVAEGMLTLHNYVLTDNREGFEVTDTDFFTQVIQSSIGAVIFNSRKYTTEVEIWLTLNTSLATDVRFTDTGGNRMTLSIPSTGSVEKGFRVKFTMESTSGSPTFGFKLVGEVVGDTGTAITFATYSYELGGARSVTGSVFKRPDAGTVIFEKGLIRIIKRLE